MNYSMLTCLTRCESHDNCIVPLTAPPWTLLKDEGNFDAMDVRRHRRESWEETATKNDVGRDRSVCASLWSVLVAASLPYTRQVAVSLVAGLWQINYL